MASILSTAMMVGGTYSMKGGLRAPGCPGPREELFCVDSYDYVLHPRLIAQEASPERDRSRLLVLSKNTGRCRHTWFCRIEEHLKAGDLLVVNNSRVLPARLLGKKETGGEVDILVLSPCCLQWGNQWVTDEEVYQEKDWLCLMRCSGSPRPHTRIFFGEGLEASILERSEDGIWRIRFNNQGSLLGALEREGLPPLPPYIKRPVHTLNSHSFYSDRERYQTIFAREPGSVAAPTAGLHFTKELCQKLERAGIGLTEITLHVGLATFRPIRTDDIRSHTLLPERYSISEDTARKIEEARRESRRIIAVGTTVVRCLESAFSAFGAIVPHRGWATVYIVPGYSFRVTHAIITNFHLPRTSLLVLVSAFAGRELVIRAYEEAIRRRYRFYSYGDAMLIQ